MWMVARTSRALVLGLTPETARGDRYTWIVCELVKGRSRTGAILEVRIVQQLPQEARIEEITLLSDQTL